MIFSRRKSSERPASRVMAAALPERHAADPAERLGNPLRGLTPTSAAALLSDAMRGCWTRAQWLMYYVEQWDADVWTLVERRCAGLRQLDWTIRTDSQAEERGLMQLADEQKKALHAWYSSVQNMREAVEFLALAKFRGYAHLAVGDFAAPASRSLRLEPIDQWWWVREGLYGGWYYNPQASMTTYRSLGEPVDESRYIIRVEPRSLVWLSILKFLRANQSQRWWDRFCEEAARQGTVIVGPPGMTADQQEQFEAAALAIARSGSGVLANGSTVEHTGAEAAAQTTVWEQRLRWLQEQLILAGTGGMLTALTQATGIGGSQGEEQGAVWRTLLRADAGDISEVFQEQADRRILEAEFPGQPILAWWELDASETPSTDQVLEHALKASQAGYRVDADQLTERTGYDLEAQAAPAAAAGWPPGVGRGLANRAGGVAGSAPSGGAGLRVTVPELDPPESWAAPVRAALDEMIRRAGDPSVSDADLLAWLEAEAAALPALSRAMDVAGLAASLEAGMRAAVEGVVEGASGA